MISKACSRLPIKIRALSDYYTNILSKTTSWILLTHSKRTANKRDLKSMPNLSMLSEWKLSRYDIFYFRHFNKAIERPLWLDLGNLFQFQWEIKILKLWNCSSTFRSIFLYILFTPNWVKSEISMQALNKHLSVTYKAEDPHWLNRHSSSSTMP